MEPQHRWESVTQRTERGRDARARSPRSAHGDWSADPQRRDPVDILTEQEAQRVDWLVPIRHERMAQSPFTFFRGAAAVMASDLAGTPDSGLWVQAGGDAHLANFGAYASPSRRLVFDQNDFDETLPGPWEWDLKRLAASLVVAGENRAFPAKVNRKVVLRAVQAYRTAMSGYAARSVLDVWYDHLDVADLEQSGLSRQELRERVAAFAERARSKTNLQALKKLTYADGGTLRIRHQPPLLVPLRELPEDVDPDEAWEAVHHALAQYAASTPDHIQILLERFRLQDVALKVVGVGSVGTRCWVLLMEGRDDGDPLFLQIKEAMPSVLEDHLRPSAYAHQGQRVVEGQRLVQAESDVFLGWTTGLEQRHFYVRQLRDWKGSVDLEQGTAADLRFYGTLCARTLARGHARSGDAVAIDAYLGTSAQTDEAFAEFALRYAAQNRADYESFMASRRSGGAS